MPSPVPTLAPTRTNTASSPPNRGFYFDGWAEETFLHRLGITRVGDLTDLDTIGIPVWFASRPNSRGLSVSQGKGLTGEQARISAVMEAAEGAVAERTEPIISHHCSIAQAESEKSIIVPLGSLQRCNSGALDPDRSRAWVRGFGLESSKTVYAPYELIGLDMRSKAGWDHRAFSMSSIGLGAGRTEQQATLHALYELLENDATAFLQLFGLTAGCRRPIECRKTANEDLGWAIEQVESKGITARFFDLTGTIPVPTIGCFLQSALPGSQEDRVQLTAGFACRSDPGDAALAALLEAVQSRLTKIAGSREDLGKETYQTGFAPLPQQEGPVVDIAAMTSADADSSDQGTVLAATSRRALNASRAEEIFVFPLAEPELGLHVIRLLVPGMESVVDEGVMRLGGHMLARLLERKADT